MVRLGNLAGRAILDVDGAAVDVATASGDRFGPAPQDVYEHWDDFLAWARDLDATGVPYALEELGAPSPTPGQIIAIGVNYAEHGAEVGYPSDNLPSVFTKFPSSLTGPVATVVLSGARVDWEVELVVVVGRGGRDIPREQAWDHIAGLTVGQDISDRAIQLAGERPQFSLGKSFAGYSPCGPLLVATGDVPDRDDLAISCRLGDEILQSDRTISMIYDVPEIVARVSAVIELQPGDVIFTGTPAGIGNRRTPPRYLGAGDVLVSEIEGLGSLTTTFIAKEA